MEDKMNLNNLKYREISSPLAFTDEKDNKFVELSLNKQIHFDLWGTTDISIRIRVPKEATEEHKRDILREYFKRNWGLVSEKGNETFD